MSLSLYRPMRFSEIMNRMFDDALTNPRTWDFGLPLDVVATAEEYVITAAVPGLKPDDLKVEIQENTVTIQGETTPPARDEKATCLLQEVRYGRFVRSVTLDGDLDGSKAEATVEHGLLTLRIPRAEAAKPKAIKVKAK